MGVNARTREIGLLIRAKRRDPNFRGLLLDDDSGDILEGLQNSAAEKLNTGKVELFEIELSAIEREADKMSLEVTKQENVGWYLNHLSRYLGRCSQKFGSDRILGDCDLTGPQWTSSGQSSLMDLNILRAREQSPEIPPFEVDPSAYPEAFKTTIHLHSGLTWAEARESVWDQMRHEGEGGALAALRSRRMLIDIRHVIMREALEIFLLAGYVPESRGRAGEIGVLAPTNKKQHAYHLKTNRSYLGTWSKELVRRTGSLRKAFDELEAEVKSEYPEESPIISSYDSALRSEWQRRQWKVEEIKHEEPQYKPGEYPYPPG